MRKLTVEFEPNKRFKEMTKPYLPFDKVKTIEVLELLRWDAAKGIKLVLAEITMKNNYKLDDFKLPPGSKIISVLQNDSKKYTCLLRGKLTQGLVEVIKQMVNKPDLNLILDTPNISSKERFVMSVIGDQESLITFIQGIKKIGNIVKASFVKPIYQGNNLLSCLTNKQKEVLIQAKNLGYYEYPRKINSDTLAKNLKLGRATVVEHIRKAENRIMTHILTGY
jgi:predicted DNA binding protein